MIENAYYTPEVHGAYELVNVGDLELEEGGVIRDLQLAHTTRGELNAAKDNAILVTTWYSGTQEIWTREYIGPQHALNPDEYFIVVINQIGNGLSTSPHNAPDEISMSKFPNVRIGDDVVAQERLLSQHYGIEELQLVTGGSMGAQQTWEWAVKFPDKVKRAAPIAGTARNNPHDFLYTETLIDTIHCDPGFNGGEYSSNTEVAAGLARHAKLWSVMGFSTEFFKTEHWRGVGFDSREAFQTGLMEAYFGAMDPNDLLTMAWKWQRGDVSRHAGGDLAAALGRITAKVFNMPINEDMFFPPRDCKAESDLVAGSEFRVIDSISGHLGLFSLEPTYMEQVDRHLGELLATAV